jgi:uncharacterized GH25 family protein
VSRGSRLALAVIVGIFLGWIGSLFRGETPGAGGTGVVENPNGRGETTPAPEPTRTVALSGVVMWETWPTDPAIRGEADPAVLVPAESCVVNVWRSGTKLASGACAEGGKWSVDVPVVLDATDKLTVEILSPERLRAALDVEVPVDAPAIALPTVALDEGSTVSGSVVDGTGQNVPGVTLTAMPWPNLGESEPWRVTTDDTGAFSIDTLPAGPVTVRADHPGFAPSAVEAISPESAVTLRLEALHELRGTVVADASRLKHAVVRLEGSSVWPPIERPLDSDGGFSFDALTEGVYGVEVVVPATNPGETELASIPLENVEPSMRVTLALVEGFRIPVRVVDPEGQPVPDARVTVAYASVAMLQRVQQTGPQGLAAVGPVVPGPYVVSVGADGFLPSSLLEVDVGRNAAANEKRHEIVLARPGRIEGIVVDEAGHPVADAEVRVEANNPFVAGAGEVRASVFRGTLRAAGSLGVTEGAVPPIPRDDEPDPVPGQRGMAFAPGEGLVILSDAEGKFVIDGLVPDEYRLSAAHGDHAASTQVVVPIISGQQVTGIKLVLRSGQPVSGRVVGENGEPITTATVTISGDTVVTDDAGGFDAGLWRGKVRVVVRAPGMQPRALTIDARRGPVDREIALEEADGVLELRALDGNDQPIAGVEVTAEPLDKLSAVRIGWTDARGQVRFETLSRVPTEVQLNHPSYVPVLRKLSVTEAGAALDVLLDAGWSADLRVRAVGNGDPIEGARVRVSGAGREVEREVSTDAKGQVALDRLTGDTVRLDISAAAWTRAGTRVRRPTADARADVTVELEEAGSISGDVTDDRGEPVRGALVTVRARGRVIETARTGPDGTWHLDSIPAGSVAVSADPPENLAALLAPDRQTTDVLRGQETREVRLRLDLR